MKQRIETGLSLMLEDEYREAVQPLFDAGKVDVLEWSFDMAWGRMIPEWAERLLRKFSADNRLLGHGVSFSALSGHWSDRQAAWLQMLRQDLQRTPMRHVSEHFGFMEAGDFHQSAPLPVPRTEATLAVGRDRLQRLAETSQLPVGLENLAFAFSLDDVRQQGQFLNELLEPVDGFLVLDLHNIFCQSCNFEVSAEELIKLFPLNRVRELHVSGGSWSDITAAGQTRTLRRDTHDGPVPAEIFPLLEFTLQRCLHVESVIVEHLGTALNSVDEASQLRSDYEQVRQIVSRHTVPA
jgi:uncharacterized protein (UPF0276 family)